jgi:hypothetical protein
MEVDAGDDSDALLAHDVVFGRRRSVRANRAAQLDDRHDGLIGKLRRPRTLFKLLTAVAAQPTSPDVSGKVETFHVEKKNIKNSNAGPSYSASLENATCE